ncbi:10107_t:CDS:2, partial [Paraglomus occultum]
MPITTEATMVKIFTHISTLVLVLEEVEEEVEEVGEVEVEVEEGGVGVVVEYVGKPSVEQHGGDAWHSLLGHADAGQVTLEQGGCGGGCEQYGSLQYA